MASLVLTQLITDVEERRKGEQRWPKLYEQLASLACSTLVKYEIPASQNLNFPTQIGYVT